MSTQTAITVGALLGVLFMLTVAFSITVSYVGQDVEGFRKWLDRAEP